MTSAEANQDPTRIDLAGPQFGEGMAFVEQYIVIQPDGSLAGRDPKTGEVLSASVIPESLLADGELRRGYEFLSEHGSRINFTLLLVQHMGADGLDAAGVNMRQVIVGLSKTHGAFFLEGARAKIVKPPEQQEGARQFGAALAGQLASVGDAFDTVHKPEVDFDNQSTRPADQVLTQWLHDIQVVEAHASTMFKRLSEEAAKVYDGLLGMFIGFEVFREWYLIGKMGAALADIDAQQPGSQELDAAGLFGSFHPGIGVRLQSMNVNVSYQGEFGEHLMDDRAASMAAMIENASVPSEERIRRMAAMFTMLSELAELKQAIEF